MSTDRRVTVIGGAGFLGVALAERLRRAGTRVSVIDRAAAGPFEGSLYQRASIEDPRELTSALVATEPDIVVNLAYLVGPPAERSISLATAVNLAGQTNCMEATARAGARRYLYASSIAVYGPDQALWDGRAVSELHTCPLHLHATSYGATKTMNEFQARAFADQTGIEVCGIRLSIVTGPGRAHGLTTWSSDVLSRAAVDEHDIPIPVTAAQRSSLIGVWDAARLMDLAATFPGSLKPAYNSGGHDLSAAEFVERVRSVEPRTRFRYSLEPARQPFVHAVSGELAEREFGFRLSPIDTTVRRHMDAYRTSLGLAPRYCG